MKNEFTQVEMVSIPVSELQLKHSIIWRFINLVFPFAVGNLDKYMVVAVEQAEYPHKKEKK